MAKTDPYTASYFTGGVNSYADPAFLSERQVRWAVNMTNRGGIWQTRPGWEVVAELEGTNAQGIHIFTPNDRIPRLMAAVNGIVYEMKLPGGTLAQVPGVTFSSYAPRVFFCNTLRSLKYAPDPTGETNGQYLQVITPIRMVMMQDGVRQIASWTGDGSGQHYATTNGGPIIGTSMVWAGNRLWIASGTRVHAMDLGDPTSNLETQYLAERGIYNMTDEVTAMALTPDSSRLLVWTKDRTVSLVANVLDRAQWQNIPEFQKLLYPTLGCVGPRAVFQHFGTLWWYSQYGLINYNYALATLHDSELRFQDNEMIRSKAALASDKSGICIGAYENYMLTAVPYGSVWNTQQWVIDQTVAETGRADSPWCWSGVWTGIRPVAYATGVVNGSQYIYALSQDYDGVVRIWRLFCDRWDDNGKRIYFRMEGRRHSQGWSPETFNYAELMLMELRDRWTLRVNYEGENTPEKEINTVTRNAWNCQDSDACNTCTPKWPFTMRFRTAAATMGDCTGCENNFPIIPIPSVIDNAHSINIEGYGSVAIRAYRLDADVLPDDKWPLCIDSQAEPPATECERPIAPRLALRPMTPQTTDKFYSSIATPQDTETL
jgi:hypothetical protein